MMVVMSLERVPLSLRGALTRWLLEVRANVFVGTVSRRILDRLWDRATTAAGAGAVLQIWSVSSEQGFAMRSVGDPNYELVDQEGLVLMRVPRAVVRPAPEGGM